MHRLPWALACGLSLGVTLAACSSGPDLSPAQRELCRALLSELPTELVGASAKVEDDGLRYRYSEPAIEVTCAPSPSIPATARCVTVDGFNWYLPEDELEDLEATVTASSAGAVPGLVARIPAEYRPGDGILNDLNAALPASAEGADCGQG